MTLTAMTLLLALGAHGQAPPPPSTPAQPATKPAAADTQSAAKPSAAKPSAAKPSAAKTDALAVQVALDRAGFSPGALDGQTGANTRKALEAYRKAHGGEPPATEGVTTYRITEADAAGPFEPEIPSELPEQAKLKQLGYRNVLEALAERFHATPALLQRLNPGAKFAAGEEITVPNVEPMQVPGDEQTPQEKPQAKPASQEQPQPKPAAQEKPAGADKKAGPEAKAGGDVTVTVSKSASALTVTDAGGKVVMYAPVTSGSERDPLPIGTWKVNGVSRNPTFHYNPDLFWDADPMHAKAKIPPGPNNPVGLVWVDISKEHYGLHGTPEPSTVGRTESHGCVRLTNWDALRLAALVKPGTPVIFRQ